MPKISSESTTKSATKAAKSKSIKNGKTKEKRPPTPYQTFISVHLKEWNAANPGKAKDGMKHVAELWKNAPENPNRGKESKSRKKVPKASASEPSSSSQPATTDHEDPKENDLPSSDF